MTMNLLRQIAGSRLPVSFYRNEDIDSVRVLRAAGLVVALVPSSTGSQTLSGSPPAAQVLAVTEKGREELSKFDFPESRPPRWRFQMTRIKTAAFGRSAAASCASRVPARPQ